MSIHDSEDLAEARAQVDAAIKNFTAVVVREQDLTIEPVVTAWATYVSYSSVELERNDNDGRLVIVPDGQATTTSRGCFSYGYDAFALRYA